MAHCPNGCKNITWCPFWGVGHWALQFVSMTQHDNLRILKIREKV